MNDAFQHMKNATTDLFDQYSEKVRNMRSFTMNEEGKNPSTVRLRAEEFDGHWFVFPTIFPPKGEPSDPNDWTRFEADEQIRDAFRMSIDRNEVFPFGKDSLSAKAFAEGAWKIQE